MPHIATSGDSLTRKLAKLRATGADIERLATEYHAAIQPIRDAVQAVANVPLEERDRWANAVTALAKCLAEHGLADEAVNLQNSERWNYKFDKGGIGTAIAGQAFCEALTAAIANESKPDKFFAALDGHTFITPEDATREICAVLSELLRVHATNTVPKFAKRFQQVLAETKTDNNTLWASLAQCKVVPSDKARDAIHDWEECDSDSPSYLVHIHPSANDTREFNREEIRDTNSRELHEQIDCIPHEETTHTYHPTPPPPGRNPYLTLRHILHELFLQAACARQGEEVRNHINPTTAPWNDAESHARRRSAEWGIPFATFDPILTQAKQTMRELVQVAAGNTLTPFSPIDTRYPRLEERLQELANSIPLVHLYGSMPANVRNWLAREYLADPDPAQVEFDNAHEPLVLVHFEEFSTFLCESGIDPYPNIENWQTAGWITDIMVEEQEGEARIVGTRNQLGFIEDVRTESPEVVRHRFVGIRRAILDAPTEIPPTDSASVVVKNENSKQPDEVPNAAPFVLAREGEMWFVRAFGQEGRFRDTKGFRVLDKLLRSQGKPVAMIDLGRLHDTISDKPMPTGQAQANGLSTLRESRQDTYDDEALDSIRKEEERLLQEIDEAEDEVERADSQAALDALRAHWKAAIGKNGKPRDLNDIASTLRPRITGQLSTVREKLRDGKLGELADHLESPTIRAEGLSFIYTAQIIWNFSRE